MEQVIIEVYRRLVQSHHCSVDDILETPELRGQYLDETGQLLGNLPEPNLTTLDSARTSGAAPTSGRTWHLDCLAPAESNVVKLNSCMDSCTCGSEANCLVRANLVQL